MEASLLQYFPKWSQNLKDLNQKMHVKCSYNGFQLSKTEFPQKYKKWFRNSTQKNIIFPFYAKPWPNPPKKNSLEGDLTRDTTQKDHFFLMNWGMETNQPFWFSPMIAQKQD